jgi:predicted dehydrogenase
MAKINWGIIGLGTIAKKFAEGFSKSNNASIKAIASKKKENLNLFKKKISNSR